MKARKARVKKPKVRRVWAFKPVTRVVEGRGKYRRSAARQETRHRLEEEL